MAGKNLIGNFFSNNNRRHNNNDRNTCWWVSYDTGMGQSRYIMKGVF